MYISRSIHLLLITTVWMLCACKKEKTDSADDKAGMLMQVNALRTRGCTCGTTYMPPVKPLQWNDTLAMAAKAHASDMISKGYFSHISPSGTAPIQRTMAFGYSGNYVTENIAKGYATLNEVMQAWQNSELHCRAMMDSLQTEMGMAVVNTYWVQEFGSRR